LRRFFEVDAEHVAYATLFALAQRGEIDKAILPKALAELGINPDAPHPWTV
jgi:pyruvate dehydrogenase E1 component